MSAKRVLVTGGSGFLGSEILKALQEQRAYDIAVLDVQPLKPESLQRSDVRFFHADVTDLGAVVKAVDAARPDIIIHSAGYVPTRNSRYSQRERDFTFRVNVDGTKNVLAAAKKAGVKYLVYTSSVTVITDNIDHDHPNMTEDAPVGLATLIYGESKVSEHPHMFDFRSPANQIQGIAERLVLDANSDMFKTCALRPSTLCGFGDYQLVPAIHGCIEKGETPFIVGSGLNLYDFSFAPNIADAHVLAIENLLGSGTAAGEAFFISNGEPVPFRAFCVAIWAHFGHIPPYQVRIPKTMAHYAGLAAEIGTFMTGKPATLSRGSVKDACQIGYVSIEKARRILGYNPRVSLSDGLKAACMDYKRRLENGEPVPRP